MADVILESAITSIIDCEDSVAAVDVEDKLVVYRNWLGLMAGDLSATFAKNGAQFQRRLAEDRIYAAPDGSVTSLLVFGDNGSELRSLVRQMFGKGYPTEAVVRFGDNETAYCLQRRDGKPPHNTAFLGVSVAPYTQWQWHDLKMYFGGPNFIQIPSGQWIAAGRLLNNGVATTALAELDVEQKSLRPILSLPSGGDTSYPGLVWHDGKLWMSFYSSHEGQTAIYLATFVIGPKR